MVISESEAITIEQAIEIARGETVPLGKSTLQRWALKWHSLHSQSPVKCTVFFTNGKKAYVLHRDEFKAWLFDRKQNLRPHETLQDPEGSHEVSQDPARPRKASRDFERPSREAEESEEVEQLRRDNRDLKIDLEVRKRLLEAAAEQVKQERERSEIYLRQIGGLEYRLQLGPGRIHDAGEGRAQRPPEQGPGAESGKSEDAGFQQ